MWKYRSVIIYLPDINTILLQLVTIMLLTRSNTRTRVQFIQFCNHHTHYNFSERLYIYLGVTYTIDDSH